MPKRLCPTCKQLLSTGASLNGKSKFFCTADGCPERFKTIDDPNVVVKSDA